MFVVPLILALAAVAAIAVGIGGLAGRLPETGLVGVRTEQTLSDPLLWRTANRVAGPALVAAGVIFLGGAAITLVMDAPWSLVAAAVALIAGLFLAGFGALQGARAASIQARMQMPDAVCCSADDDGATCGDHGACGDTCGSAPSDDPAADCGVTGGCGACALKGMCDHEAKPV